MWRAMMRKMEELGGLSDRPLDANAKTSIFTNESGLYSLIVSSKKAEARAFKKWVTSEVLPQTRKTGDNTVPCCWCNCALSNR